MRRRLGRFVELDVVLFCEVFDQKVAFLVVAARAGGDHVFPRRFAASATRYDVVVGKLGGTVLAHTVLARKKIARVDVASSEVRISVHVSFLVGSEGNYRRHAHFEVGGPDDAFRRVFGDDDDAVHEDCLDGVLPRPHRQRNVGQGLVIRIQHECRGPLQNLLRIHAFELRPMRGLEGFRGPVHSVTSNGVR